MLSTDKDLHKPIRDLYAIIRSNCEMADGISAAKD